MIRTGFCVVGFLLVLLMVDCGEINIVQNQTANEQLEIDLGIIEEYRKDEGLTFVEDSVTYPIQYTILEQGTGKEISLGDIVFCDYVVRLSSGEVVNTSIESVAIENDLFAETSIYKPLVFTFTETGWSISPILPPTSSSSANHEAGWRRGITAALKRMKVGGSSLIVSPSIYAYSALSNLTVPSNSVIIYEAYVINAK